MNFSPVAVWACISVVLFVIEAVTVNLLTIWFALGALAALAVAWLGGNIAVQIVVFATVSVVLLVFTKPLLKKYVKKVPTNADALIGKTAVVTEKIDNIMAEGRVKINGMTWAARSADEKNILEGTAVTVLKIEGVKLIVREGKEC